MAEQHSFAEGYSSRACSLYILLKEHNCFLNRIKKTSNTLSLLDAVGKIDKLIVLVESLIQTAIC